MARSIKDNTVSGSTYVTGGNSKAIVPNRRKNMRWRFSVCESVLELQFAPGVMEVTAGRAPPNKILGLGKSPKEYPPKPRRKVGTFSIFMELVPGVLQLDLNGECATLKRYLKLTSTLDQEVT